MTRDTSFTISSGPVTRNPESCIQVLKNVARTIREDYAGKSLYVHALHAVELPHGDLPSNDCMAVVQVDFWCISKEEIEEYSENQKQWRENGLIEATPLKELIHKKPEHPEDIGMVEQRLVEPAYPADITTLLDKVCETIKGLGDVEILDLVYQDYSDKDTSQQPSIRFYYMSKEGAVAMFKYTLNN